MLIKPSQWPIFIVNAVGLAAFTLLFISRQNYEFLLYIGVIIIFLAVIVGTNKKVSYPDSLLWGLTAWAYLHMAGGGVYIGGEKLYALILIPISGEYGIFRYDQFVHIVGFGVSTLLMYYLLTLVLPERPKQWTAVSIIVVMAGLGVGALNEIVEFAATVIVPETGVGGYVNTSLDLVADLIGALLALVYIRLRGGEI
jgi:putative membrane protein